MFACTLAWYLDFHWCLLGIFQSWPRRLGAWTVCSLLPILPPDFFFSLFWKKVYFSILTRFEAGLWSPGFLSVWTWKGPLEKQALLSCSSGGWAQQWSLLLKPRIGHDLVGASALPASIYSCLEDAFPRIDRSWVSGVGGGQPSMAAHTSAPQTCTGGGYGTMGRFLRAGNGSFLNVITCK